VEKRDMGTGITVDWIPSQAYYSTITFILKTHIWKIFKKIINLFLEVDLLLDSTTYFRWKRGKGGEGLQ